MCQPSGQIGSFKYYTLKDLQTMYNSIPHNTKNPALYLNTHGMFDMAMLLKKYATILANYESRYIDDGK